VILERTHPWGDRPLLGTSSDPRQAVERLLRDRAPHYALADLTIDTSDLTIAEVAARVLAGLKLAPGASPRKKPCDPSP
jgi:shikimate kinase